MNKPLTTRHCMTISAVLFALSAFTNMATGEGEVKWYVSAVGAVVCMYLGLVDLIGPSLDKLLHQTGILLIWTRNLS